MSRCCNEHVRHGHTICQEMGREASRSYVVEEGAAELGKARIRRNRDPFVHYYIELLKNEEDDAEARENAASRYQGPLGRI